MKFHLVYKGLLPSSGNKPKPKWAAHIRKKIHPQMQELWRTHKILHRIKRTAIVSKHDSAGFIGCAPESTLDSERDVERYPATSDEIDLSAPITSGPYAYLPLVRETLHLNCSLSITFLRHDDPGSITTGGGGDLDGRIKCLLDALTMPNADQAAKFPPNSQPMFCLMEDDSLVSDLDIKTGRLLVPGERHKHEVQLIIEVVVNVLRVGPWNLPLLGR